MASFLAYILYTQTHCLVKVLGSTVTGTSTTIDATRPLVDALKVKLELAAGSHQLVTGKRIMYLANHRSWADFAVDSVLTNGGSYLARYGIIFGVPMSGLWGWISGSVFFFNRKKGIDRDWFTRFIEGLWKYRPTKGLIVYPEGTRNLSDVSLPLKKGAMEVAYKLKVPVQVIITTNKDRMVNEKNLTVEYGVKMVVYYSKTIDPNDYENVQAWYTAIQDLWNDSWERSHSATESTPFEGKALELVTKAAPEPSVPHRLWILRSIVIATVAVIATKIAQAYFEHKDA